MNTDTLGPLLPLLIATGYLLYKGARRTLLALSRRRNELWLTKSGIRTHGVVHSVRPMGRPSGRHAVTVLLHDDGGGSWEAVDESGTGGYLLREGTPVTVLYAPLDHSNARVERAAFPDPSRGDYPLYRDGIPEPPSLVAALSPLALSLVTLSIAVLIIVNRTDTALSLIPPLFVVLGLGVLVGAAYRLFTDTRTRPEYSASATGTVTDCWTETKRVRRRNRGWTTVRVHPFTVYFQSADGREVHLRHPAASSGFAPVPQQPLHVEYDPAHPPHYSLPDRRDAGRVLALAPFLLGAVFVLVGSVLVFVL